MPDVFVSLSPGDAKFLRNTTDDLIGALGVGIARTEGTIHAHTASAGAVTAAVVADDVVIENNDDGGASIIVPDNKKGNIYFSTPSDGAGAFMQRDYTQRLFTIGTANSTGIFRVITANAVEAFRIDASKNVILKGTTLRIETQKTPASATAAGVKGDIVHDASYIYVCTATNVWKRSAISTW